MATTLIDTVLYADLPPVRSVYWWLRLAVTFLISCLLEGLSCRTLSCNPHLNLIWLPAGMALFAVWRWGFAMLPAVVLAEFCLLAFSVPWIVVSIWVAGTAAEIALAVWLLRRLHVSPDLEQVRNLLWLTATALILGPAGSGVLVSALLTWAGVLQVGSFGISALNWWLGNANGILTLAPLLLLLQSRKSRQNLRLRWREFAALFACGEMIDLWGLLSSGPQKWVGYPLDHLLNITLLWAALRFGPLGVAILCPLALLQSWMLPPGGNLQISAAHPAMPLPFPLLNLTVSWITILVLACVVWEARDTESELQKSTQTLADIIKALPLAVLAIDPRKRVLEWNRAAEGMLGGERQERIGSVLPLDPETELGRRLHDLYHAGPLDGLDVAWHDVNRDTHQRLRLYSARMEMLPATPGAMVLIADVTAQRALEERLQQVQKLEKIGRLAGGMAQDLARLLGVIQTEAEGLVAAAPSPGILERAEEMRATSARAFPLIHQLQAFSQRQPLEPGEIELQDAIRSCLPFLRDLAGPAVTIEMHPSSCSCRVPLTDAQLEQILLNLVANARDAMPHGGRLALAVLNRPETEAQNRPDGPSVRLMVTDTGCGMSPEVRSRIFEPFFTTKEVGRGSGLGLATVYGIVQQVGGSIQVWSQPGGGTRFEILLPCVRPRPETMTRE